MSSSNKYLSEASEVKGEHYEHLKKVKFIAAFTIANIVATATLIYTDPLYNKTLYHTSALTGANWALKLLNGHPKCIFNELGVHKHVFHALIDELKLAGYKLSKHVYLEEQFAIFLYTCITGILLHHICEHFQCSSNTISK